MLSSKKELKKFSEAFKFVRNQRFPNKSLKNVSFITGFSLHELYDWENAKAIPSIPKLINIVNQFKITLSLLLLDNVYNIEDVKEMLSEEATSSFKKLDFQNFKLNLKGFCIEAGMTYKDLAQYLNLDVSMVNDYENKNTAPSIKSLIKMSKLFDCSLDDFFLESVDQNAIEDFSKRQFNANLFKQLRTQHFLTLKDLQNQTGISISTLSKYEQNQLQPTLVNVNKLSFILDVSADELYIKKEEDNKTIKESKSLSVGAVLKELRKIRSVSVYNIAKALSISVNLYKNFEKSSSLPATNDLVKLAAFFNVPISFLAEEHSDLNSVRTELESLKDYSNKDLDPVGFADTLKKYRFEHNLSENEISNLLGVLPETYSKYENGDDLPSYTLLKQMSDLFNCSVEDLFLPKVIEAEYSEIKDEESVGTEHDTKVNSDNTHSLEERLFELFLDKEFDGSVLKRYRVEKNLSQKEIFSYFSDNYKASICSKWECGVITPSFSQLLTVANLLKVDPECFFVSPKKEPEHILSIGEKLKYLRVSNNIKPSVLLDLLNLKFDQYYNLEKCVNNFSNINHFISTNNLIKLATFYKISLSFLVEKEVKNTLISDKLNSFVNDIYKKYDPSCFFINLEYLTNRNHLTKAELSELLNISSQYYWKNLNNNRLPSYSIIKKLSELFNCSSDTLFLPQKDLLSVDTKVNEICNENKSTQLKSESHKSVIDVKKVSVPKSKTENTSDALSVLELPELNNTDLLTDSITDTIKNKSANDFNLFNELLTLNQDHKLFIYKITDDSMSRCSGKSLNKDLKAIICCENDPNKLVNKPCLVVTDKNEIMLREISFENANLVLTPWNSSYDVIKINLLTQKAKILGYVSKVFLDFDD